MTEYKIVLKPVYSETVETPKGIEIPDGWRLAWHQLETFKALQNPDIDVVFNTAMTGDGKSLAAYLGVLQGNTEAIAADFLILSFSAYNSSSALFNLAIRGSFLGLKSSTYLRS